MSEIQEIVKNLVDLRHCYYTYTYNSNIYNLEGVYNEYSLIDELINHINNKPKLSKTQWYESFEIWENFVKKDIKRLIENNQNENIEEFEDYLEEFLDRMDLIYDFAELIFK